MIRLIARRFTVLFLALAGCATPPPPLMTEPLGLQMVRVEPSLSSTRFVNVLGFEFGGDEVFQSGGRIVARSAKSFAHTGNASLAVQGDVTIRLNSLLAGRSLPGGWTLFGVFVFATGPASVDIAYGETRCTQQLVPEKWTRVWVDISTLVESPACDLIVAPHGPVKWLDDVILVDNRQSLFSGNPSKISWRVEREGLHASVTFAEGRRATFPLAFDEKPAEISDARLVLRSSDAHVVVLYPDGRRFEDGRCAQPPTDLLNTPFAPIFLSQHSSSAHVEVPAAVGTVDRVTRGDANNDGYNESVGTYRISAKGAHVEFTITPTNVPTIRPMFEISGLGAGTPHVTVEGKWIETAFRLPNGNWLVELPLNIERASTVVVGVQ